MKLLKLLLFPFALLYGGIMLLRNFLYDQGFFESVRFTIPVISVGNLTVGGTGKTPHVEFLLRLLKNRKTATLSRGYKRKSKGFVLADQSITAEILGDEPYQYFLDFPDTSVAVCEKRVEGIQKIQALKPQTEVIILDDAFQHRAVTPKLNLLITDFYRRFDTDFMLPTGLLREPRSGAKRADAVIVSKCPLDIVENEKAKIRAGIKKYIKNNTPIFFSSYKYGAPVCFGKEINDSGKILLVTGIANAQPLIEYFKENDLQVLKHFEFPDHYAYTEEDLERISQSWNGFQTANSEIRIVTTRKDAVKLAQTAWNEQLSRLPFYYLPIEVVFLEQQAAFENLILSAI